MTTKTEAAATAAQKALAPTARTGIILGSGLGRLTGVMTESREIPFDDIPHFPTSTVKGHSGRLISGCLEGCDLLVLSGRVHYYEGYPISAVTFPLEVMAKLGIRRLIVTNASGAINRSFNPGDIIAISDHINFMGTSPLRGAPDFVDLSEAYSRRLWKLAREAAGSLGTTLASGVYAAMSGPCFETPAEIRMLATLGADLVGMSTVPEVITARRAGIEVLGLSMVSNMAAGISETPLSHQEVMEATHKAAGAFRKLVTAIVTRLADDENR